MHVGGDANLFRWDESAESEAAHAKNGTLPAPGNTTSSSLIKDFIAIDTAEHKKGCQRRKPPQAFSQTGGVAKARVANFSHRERSASGQMVGH